MYNTLKECLRDSYTPFSLTAIAKIEELQKVETPVYVRGYDGLSFMGKKHLKYKKYLYEHKKTHKYYVPYTYKKRKIYIYDGAQPFLEKFIIKNKLQKKSIEDVLVLMRLAEEY